MPSIEAKYGGYGQIFLNLLRAGADAANEPSLVSSTQSLNMSQFDIVNDGENYPRVEDIDAVLLTGSSMPNCPSPPLLFLT